MRNIVMLAMVLVAPTIAAAVLNRLMGRSFVSNRFATRLGLALVLFFTGTAHFVQTGGRAFCDRRRRTKWRL